MPVDKPFMNLTYLFASATHSGPVPSYPDGNGKKMAEIGNLQDALNKWVNSWIVAFA